VRFGGVLEWRTRPTPGCSAIEEEEEEEYILNLYHYITVVGSNNKVFDTWNMK
jgi:hypothetical protein